VLREQWRNYGGHGRAAATPNERAATPAATPAASPNPKKFVFSFGLNSFLVGN